MPDKSQKGERGYYMGLGSCYSGLEGRYGGLGCFQIYLTESYTGMRDVIGAYQSVIEAIWMDMEGSYRGLKDRYIGA